MITQLIKVSHDRNTIFNIISRVRLTS